MRFTLTIDTDNAAFHPDDGRFGEEAPEIARILRQAAASIESFGGLDILTGTPLVLRDLNGNRVGSASVTTPTGVAR